MSKIYNDITELIGNTPLVKLNKYSKEENITATLLAKLESFNPGGSAKDRVGYNMIIDAENKGLLKRGSVIIEPTSGNTGIGLAMVAITKGYRVILTMPDTMSVERQMLLRAYGAEIVLTAGNQGMNGAVNKANELAKIYPDSFIPSQFSNISNTEAHRKTTAVEILNDTDGLVDIFIAGVGTGGTISGVGEVLKQKNPNISIIAVEPFDSPMLTKGISGPHSIQGIGANFIPEVLNRNIIDEIYPVKGAEAVEAARKLVKFEGILTGISSGAALFAATEIAKRAGNENKTIVVLLPDGGEKYLSTGLFD